MTPDLHFMQKMYAGLAPRTASSQEFDYPIPEANSITSAFGPPPKQDDGPTVLAGAAAARY